MEFPNGSHTADRYPLRRWAEGGDGPWHPPDLTSGTEDGSGQSMVTNLRNSQFTVHSQPNMVPSDIMQHSDSGYASYGNHHSIADCSVRDDSYDANPEIQSIIGGPMSMSGPQFGMSNIMPHDTLIGSPWANDVRIETTNFKCDTCHQPVKTKSELKKHDQRHKKPFKCKIEGCPREDGFSTPNDLDRHMRSLHPDTKTAGHRYRCQIDACKSKEKIWPRADNFKAHLKRVHGREKVSDAELEKYRYRPPPSSPDETREIQRQESESHTNEYSNQNEGQINSWQRYSEEPHGMNLLGPLHEAQREGHLSLSGSQGVLPDLHIPCAAPLQGSYNEASGSAPTSYSPMTLSSPTENGQSPQESEAREPVSSPPQGPMTKPQRIYPTETPVSYEGASNVNPLDGPGELVSSDSPGNDLTDHLGMNNRVSDSVEPEDLSAHSPSRINTEFSNLDLNNTDVMKKLVDVLQSRGLLERFGYKKEGSEAVEPTKSEVQGAINLNHHRCPKCPKSFPRKCELKKHEKRHEKPYGCTMPDCDKRFGSKNDWKRHENTQHFRGEMWLCDEESCGVDHSHRDQFRRHLERSHQIADQNELEVRLERCRVGEDRFWCGFCQRIVGTKEKELHGRAERFDHIDNHITGRNGQDRKEISEWRSFGTPRRSKELPKEDSDAGDYASSPTTPEGMYHSPSRSKPKRKRGEGSHFINLKKARLTESTVTECVVCCGCRDIFAAWLPSCMNCEHKRCDNCTRAR
ncbi:putative C2H2 type zinc finger domain-containing protein [Rosellinia necatrix]|uniref:Putative C2H2 type zinc finger domain-containing protein n=1 Tax=Rosellinia necatrix TaxID=77044 RepID=A0A1W2TMJ2_ROSNE|nr:putative C2H2 type zinc finger domain-containing protein [Rosellinia necatrix]